MKLLVATWGNPRAWSEVEYVLGGVSVRSACSTEALFRAERPEEVVIIALDTLGSGSSYERVVSEARELVEGYAKAWGLEPRVLVAPGKGRFKGREFQGQLLDYYHWVFHALSEVILEKARRLSAVVLDLSHGVNFMPVLTYRATRELLEALNIFRPEGNPVRLKVYNSDPHTQESKALSLNLLEDVASPPGLSVPSAGQHELRPLEPLFGGEERAEFLKTHKVPFYAREIRAFLSALKNGFPLLLSSAYPDPRALSETLRSFLRAYREGVEVELGSPGLVRRRFALTADFTLLALARFAAEALREFGYLSGKLGEAPLSQLKTLAERLYDYDPRLARFVGVDIHEIEELKGSIKESWESLNAAMARHRGYPPREGSPDIRNFAAHSGLERNAVEVRKKGREILLRYKRELWPKVLEFADWLLG